jgi:hypothetical protein
MNPYHKCSHTYYRLQLHVVCNLFYAITRFNNCMRHMQLKINYIRQLQMIGFLLLVGLGIVNNISLTSFRNPN